MSNELNKEHQETLLQTIQARLEWNDSGNVEWIDNPKGSWKIVPAVPKAPFTRYFTLTYKLDIDPYGKIKPDNHEPTHS